MPNPICLVGQRFGRLLVLAKIKTHGDAGSRDTRWLCACDCGKRATVALGRLRKGETRSCGCLRRELSGKTLRTHGASNTLTWKRWRSMVARCTMVNAKNYRYYGGRGIRFCERWKQFENFLADMSECPGPKFTLDRKNNDGNYEPSNCRWATELQQRRNRSTNRLMTYQGETLCASEWADLLGLNLRTIYTRMNKGWLDVQVLGTPVRPHAPRQR